MQTVTQIRHRSTKQNLSQMDLNATSTASLNFCGHLRCHQVQWTGHCMLDNWLLHYRDQQVVM